ncbi:hypothetical protein B7755_036375 [Streptomyces sp. NBS 14/10]|uniref:TRAFAC clade GTPase domain-containing protein n=1 Tax=Streptomyces sp. NBS 14/10 TaxID=1945643 RepID=UPI000B7D56DE|nr:hypothetical protein [Streptomyces sp. NBS 14/10]KAK1183132.1 hypothetical protein B7755_036375 [Streptomyces sp. NBS 14/10]
MEKFNVVALGPSGSGKTVYLAALQERLRTQDPELGFHVRLPRDQERKLTEVYSEVASSGDWPAPTDRTETPEWTFTCRMWTRFGVFETMQIEYIDYAGEHLTHPVGEGSQVQDWFEERLETADALLGLLDGVKIRGLLFGNRGAEDFLRDDLAPMFSLMQGFPGPIHFVVTKWDLVEQNFTLADVRQRLMREPTFSQLVASRAPGKTRRFPVPPGRIRLIPVSAVGRGFAVLDSEGKVRKLDRTNPKPMNVEIPLVSVLPDLCVRAYEALRISEARRAAGQDPQQDQEAGQGQDLGQDPGDQSEAGAPGSPGRVRKLLAAGLSPQLQAQLMKSGITVSPAVLAGFLDAALGALGQLASRSPREVRRAKRLQRSWRGRRVKSVKDEKSAVHHTVHRLVGQLGEFERAEPDSILA